MDHDGRPWPCEPSVQPPWVPRADDEAPRLPVQPFQYGLLPPLPALDAERAALSTARPPLRLRRPHGPHHGQTHQDASAAAQQPIESLVGRLSKQTLRAREEDDADSSAHWEAPAPSPQQGLVREQSNMAMDVDGAEMGAGKETGLPRLSLEQMRRQRRHARRDFVRASRAREAMARPLQSATVPHHQSPKTPETPATEPMAESMCLGPDLEADEGFSEGLDDMAWMGDDSSSVAGLPRTVRSNNLLRFRTSTEAALQCSLVVHKTARMRKRRQKKTEETRLTSAPCPRQQPN